MSINELDVQHATEWRSWLRKNHLSSQGVWLVFRKKSSAESTISYEQAMDEALSYGWIDSQIKKLDSSRYVRKFTPRRAGSIWSKSNIERVHRLKEQNQMTRWGLKAFEERTSEISMLEKFKIQPIPVPEDLLAALKRNEKAWTNFQQFTPSYKKRYTMWITSAKKIDTRRERVAEAVSLISKNVKALLK